MSEVPSISDIKDLPFEVQLLIAVAILILFSMRGIAKVILAVAAIIAARHSGIPAPPAIAGAPSVSATPALPPARQSRLKTWLRRLLRLKGS